MWTPTTAAPIGTAAAPDVQSLAPCYDPHDAPPGFQRPVPAVPVARCRRTEVELGELYAWSTAFGLGSGLALSDQLGLFDGAGYVLLTGATITLSALAVYGLDTAMGQMPSEVAVSIGTGLLLGFGEGLGIDFAVSGGKEWPMASTGGAAAGAVGFGLLGALMRPRVGDLSLLRSGALWGTYFSQLLNVVAEDSADDRATGTRMLVGMNTGLALAAISAQVLHWSRRRILCLDAGGVAGTFVGAVIAGPALVDPKTLVGAIALTTVGGMVLGALLSAPSEPETQEMADARQGPDVGLYASPTRGGATLGATGTF